MPPSQEALSLVIYATERNFCGSFPGKIFLGEVLAVQPMVDAWEIIKTAVPKRPCHVDKPVVTLSTTCY